MLFTSVSAAAEFLVLGTLAGAHLLHNGSTGVALA